MVNRWFSAADLAEIDLVSKLLSNAIFEHKERCQECREAGRYCTPIVEAIEAAVDWAEIRMLTSKAAALRAMQSRADERAA
jgi:hypothetical protein